MLLAGGQGSRLYALTKDMAKPAVPYGGKYRIIDFPLSNCVNSGIDTVGVLTQYQPLVLNEYIGNGHPWGLDRVHGGVHVLPPYESSSGKSWYEGTANAIYQNISFIDRYNPEYVAVLSGDHIYKMNYNKMLEFHKAHNADATIAVLEVPWEEAPRFGIMSADENDVIYEFAEKPAQPKSNLASMGVYIFSWQNLKSTLSPTKMTRAQARTSVRILSLQCWQRATSSLLITLTATGRMSELSTACGKQIWIFLIPTFLWSFTIQDGEFIRETL